MPEYDVSKDVDDLATKIYEDWDGIDINALINAYASAIQAERAGRQWIPVAERLPEDGEDVIVLRDGGFVTGGYVTDGQWYVFSATTYLRTFTATHWQPMPDSSQ